MEIIIIVTFIIILLNTIKYQITHLVESVQELEGLQPILTQPGYQITLK